jgi:MFS-type transporter involved in bile tolerance (Atg22 family)
LNDRIVATFGARKTLIVSSFLNFLYILTYFFSASCNTLSTGACNHGFLGTLLIIGAILGGFGLSCNHSSKKKYLDKYGLEEDLARNYDIFMLISAFSCILATIIALSLLADAKLRTGLYVILVILSANAVIIQLSNFTLTISST